MSLTKAASNGTSIQQSATLPNPFDLEDSKILDRVYLIHVNDDELCNTKTLYDLVSNVLLESSSPIPLGSFKPEFTTLKLISCQMISTRGAAHCAHQTALWILQYLRGYSWEAKALITLAAFCLEYGSFAHLSRVSTADPVGNAMKQLNQVQSRKVTGDITELVTYIVQVYQQIQQWATWSSAGLYDPEDVPALTEAMQEIPVVVYWTIASIVASTGNLIGVSNYTLSEYRQRLYLSVVELEKHLKACRIEISFIDDYLTRRKAFDKPKDIVDLLKALLHRNATEIAQIHEAGSVIKEGVGVFKQKHVLLFISGLDSIDDEIALLNSIYDRLQENSKDVKGFKKEDFKILWIPVLDVDVKWDENARSKFNMLKNRIKWFVAEYFGKLAGYKIITDPDRLGYKGKPMIAVLDPQGKRLNNDAMQLIFQWGIEAFPFREKDGLDLHLKWKWLWDILKKVIPGLQVREDRYIFIYGSSNNKWIQDFTMELDQLKRNADIKRADVLIDHYQLGKEEPNKVPNFWIGIERTKQNKMIKHQETLDCEIQTIAKSLFCLKRDPQGWVILSKGYNVKLLGHGEAMYLTAHEIQNWQDKVLEKEGFDIAFREYYDAKVKEVSARQPCSFVNVDNYAASVIATITCPNPTCGRVMEVTSVNYKCCHQDVPNSCLI